VFPFEDVVASSSKVVVAEDRGSSHVVHLHVEDLNR
jgi:hypothetical protein